MIRCENLPIVVSQRLFLRPMVDDDASTVVRWRNDPAILKWMFSQREITLASHLSWFHSRDDTRIDYVICLKDDGVPIGTLNLARIDWSAKRAEAGKMLGDRRQWGKGYAKEAFGAWMQYAFQRLELKGVYVQTFSTNRANIAVNRSLGFVAIDSQPQDLSMRRNGQEIIVMELTAEAASSVHCISGDVQFVG